MTSSSQWFVQTDFGALLGPMPTEVLTEMARTGALLRKDQVREGPDGDWRPASDWPHLFNGDARPLFASDTLQEPASPRETFKIVSSARLLDDLLKADTAEKPPEELDFEIDAPVVAPVMSIKPVADIESRPVVESKPAPAPAISPRPQPAEAIRSAPSPEPVVASASPPPMDRPVDWETPARTPSRRLPTIRTDISQRRSWKRLLPVGAAVLAALLLVTVWWVWPRQRPDIYTQYVAIYKELQQRREQTQDQAGWNEFAARANAQLNDVLPWLEERAKPGDREKSLLLYAGRDLQDLLGQPRDSEPAHQKRLSVFFEQLDVLYGSKK